MVQDGPKRTDAISTEDDKQRDKPKSDRLTLFQAQQNIIQSIILPLLLFFWTLKFHGGWKRRLWHHGPVPHLIWKWSSGPGLLCSSGCCSQIVSTMGTLLHGDRIPERNRSNFKRQEMQNRYPCYLLTQTFSCNNFNFTSASVLIGSDFCLTQICHSLQHLTQLLLHLA